MEEEVKRAYYSNGKLRYEIPHLNGKRHGFSKFCWLNGKLEYETPYKNGKIHGLKKWWHSNGQLEYETTYKNNITCGAEIEFKY